MLEAVTECRGSTAGASGLGLIELPVSRAFNAYWASRAFRSGAFWTLKSLKTLVLLFHPAPSLRQGFGDRPAASTAQVA